MSDQTPYAPDTTAASTDTTTASVGNAADMSLTSSNTTAVVSGTLANSTFYPPPQVGGGSAGAVVAAGVRPYVVLEHLDAPVTAAGDAAAVAVTQFRKVGEYAAATAKAARAIAARDASVSEGAVLRAVAKSSFDAGIGVPVKIITEIDA
jgi:hypothetical protein